MVIDTSALLAILTNEPERHHFNALICSAYPRLISVGSYLETAIVVNSRYGYEGVRDLRLLIDTAKIETRPFDANQVSIAMRAYFKYGKGTHPAAPNFGDCFSYALSKSTGESLLFKGDDFTKTDVLIVGE